MLASKFAQVKVFELAFNETTSISGSTIVTYSAAEQPLASVTVKLYVPAERLPML